MDAINRKKQLVDGALFFQKLSGVDGLRMYMALLPAGDRELLINTVCDTSMQIIEAWDNAVDAAGLRWDDANSAFVDKATGAVVLT